MGVTASRDPPAFGDAVPSAATASSLGPTYTGSLSTRTSERLPGLPLFEEEHGPGIAMAGDGFGRACLGHGDVPGYEEIWDMIDLEPEARKGHEDIGRIGGKQKKIIKNCKMHIAW